MSRERLMAKQRDRMKARRARKTIESKTKAATAKYGSGSKKAVTRDTSKDKSLKSSGIGPVKSGAEYSRSLTKGKSASTPKASQAPKKTTTKPKQTTKEEATSRFYQSSSGTRGQSLPSNPKLKSQSKKPSRSSFASGRSGAADYAAALRKYNAKQKSLNTNKPKPKTNRRGRRVWPASNGK